MKISYSQNREDVVLWRALLGITTGFYIDVGAGHPQHDSITRSFYDAGWSGLLIEPSDQYHQLIEIQRPRDVLLKVAASNAKGTAPLLEVRSTGYSTIRPPLARDSFQKSLVGEEKQVLTDTLDNLLDSAILAPQQIHFMTIDVEGSERQVLEGFSFTIFRPWILVVESVEVESFRSTAHKWEHLILSHDYEFCLFDGLNRFYLAAEHRDLIEKLSYPACVLDRDLVIHDINHLRAQLKDAKY